VPPFGLFLTEIYILTAGIGAHPFAVVLVLLMLALIFVGFLRFVTAMVFGKTGETIKPGEVNVLTIAPPVFLMALLLAISVSLPSALTAWLHAAAALIH